jgi:hypothetical protein
MKHFVREILLGRNAKINFLLILTVASLVGVGCFGSGRSNAKPLPTEYHGDWTGSDGSTLRIRPNASADFKQGSFSVDNATAQLDETGKVLQFAFFGISAKDLRIDQAPSGDTMKLDGVTYKRGGGSTVSTDATPEKTSSNKSSEKTSGDAASESEADTLVKDTMADFTAAVETEDFTDFYNNASRDFKASYTPESVKNSFAVFIVQKDKVMPSLQSVDTTTANFSSPPSVRTEKGYKVLTANGEFPTNPNSVKFETEYVQEKGAWKLLKFKVRM